MPAFSDTTLVRFWFNVDKRGPDQCWEWTGMKYVNGYGQIYHSTKRKAVRAHRLSWEMANGRPIPDDGVICHSCDNRCCVNPAHLWLGSQMDNLSDAKAKGRLLRKTHCKHGHKLVRRHGRRCCPTCNARRAAESYLRKKNAQPPSPRSAASVQQTAAKNHGD